jgi:hypothetical protein
MESLKNDVLNMLNRGASETTRLKIDNGGAVDYPLFSLEVKETEFE